MTLSSSIYLIINGIRNFKIAQTFKLKKVDLIQELTEILIDCYLVKIYNMEAKLGDLKSQTVISSYTHGGIRKLSYAITE